MVEPNVDLTNGVINTNPTVGLFGPDYESRFKIFTGAARWGWRGMSSATGRTAVRAGS